MLDLNKVKFILGKQKIIYLYKLLLLMLLGGLMDSLSVALILPVMNIILLTNAYYPNINILYKAGLRKIPILGLAFKLGGFVEIDRGNRDQSNLAIDQAINSLREGSSFLIFPEGTRSQTDELLPFKKGGFIMAVRAHVPIIPVAMHGGRAVMRRGSALLNPVTVHVEFGAPISTRDREFADREELIAETKSSIEDMLRRWKSTRQAINPKGTVNRVPTRD